MLLQPNIDWIHIYVEEFIYNIVHVSHNICTRCIMTGDYVLHTPILIEGGTYTTSTHENITTIDDTPIYIEED